jgi:hypothetical protein
MIAPQCRITSPASLWAAPAVNHLQQGVSLPSDFLPIKTVNWFM